MGSGRQHKYKIHTTDPYYETIERVKHLKSFYSITGSSNKQILTRIEIARKTFIT